MAEGYEQEAFGGSNNDGVNYSVETDLGIQRNEENQVTNPYGNEGFFSRVLGIDPSSISYDNLLDQGTLQGIARLNVDRYTNPYASTNVLNAPVGGSQTAGTLRSGVSAGDPTRFGEVRAQRQPMSGTEMAGRGLASLFGGPMMGPFLTASREDPLAIQGSQFYDPKLDPQSDLYEGSGMLGSLMAPFTGGVTPSDVSSNVSPIIENMRRMFSTGSDIPDTVAYRSAGRNPEMFPDRETYGEPIPVDQLLKMYRGSMTANPTDSAIKG